MEEVAECYDGGDQTEWHEMLWLRFYSERESYIKGSVSNQGHFYSFQRKPAFFLLPCTLLRIDIRFKIYAKIQKYPIKWAIACGRLKNKEAL